MKNLPTIYCAHCHKTVKPIRGIAIYRCPDCIRIILPSQIAEEMDRQDRVRESEAVDPSRA